jgi:hypothetical protein
VAKVIERLDACYEVQELEFGKVYKWQPERIVLEWECGQRLSHRLEHLLHRVQ